MGWTLLDTEDQSGRVAVVTGANIGLGYDTALALASKNCQVVLACRNLVKSQEAKQRILAQYPYAKVECIPLDLCSLKSVRKFVDSYNQTHDRLDMLINNAGIMMPPYTLSEDGFESQLAANYLGHFALTGLLLPTLTATDAARVVSVSSLAHKWVGFRFDDPNFKQGYNRRHAYGQSKLACLMFSYELNRRLRNAQHSTLSVAAHPGVSATNLAQNFPKFLTAFFPLVGQSSADGALPILYASLGDDIDGGDYCGPRSLGEMRGAPVKVRSNRASRNEADAKRLWEMSESMTGVRYLSA